MNREVAIKERLPKAKFTREMDLKSGTIKMDEGLSMTRSPDK